jgi:hypothetical protein
MVMSQGVKQLVRELCDSVQDKDHGIEVIHVLLEDMKRPYKTGIYKRCHLKMRGFERQAIDVDVIEEDLGYTIGKAFSRLYLSLAWEIDYGIANCQVAEVRGGENDSVH